MPQVDLETLVSALAGSGGSERKITCETLADEDSPDKEDVPDAAHDLPPDFPPESFWLSKDAELDWFDRNAFFERKESTKGISNSSNLNHPNSNNSSQRFSVTLKTKASLFGLPKTQKANYVCTKRRSNKPCNVKLFPKRSASVGKPVVSVFEPSSPKVSCIGRVRSKRGRRRPSENSHKREKLAEKSTSFDYKAKKGFYSKVLSIFKHGRNDKKPVQPEIEKISEEKEEEEEEGKPRKRTTTTMRKTPEVPVDDEPVSKAPGLGGLKKFSSGRRSTDELTPEVPVDDEPVSEAPGLGGLKKFSSGRRSTDEFDAALR